MGRRGRKPHPDILTPREWEVLGLLREGLSNQQIAARLNITLDGAKYHVAEILSKLDVETRETAAAWMPPREDERPWWLDVIGRLAPLTLAKAAIAAAGLVALIGAGVIVLFALPKSEEEDAHVAAAATTQTGTPDASPTLASIAPSSSPTDLPRPLTSGGGDAFAGPPIVLHELSNGTETVLAEGLYPEWSPDGQWVAFLAAWASGEVNIIRPDGTERRAFLGAVEITDVMPFSCENRLFAWSPQSDRIFFCSGAQLYTASIDEPAAPTYVVSAASFSLAPDGRRVAYGTGAFAASEVRVRDLQTGQDEHLVDGAWPAWSHDGRYIAYFSEKMLSVLDLETGLTTEVDRGESTGTFGFFDVSWSQTGSRLAYSKAGSIYVADIGRDDNPQLITTGYSPVWSPDGRNLTYHVGFSCEDVYVAPVDGSDPPKRVGDGFEADWGIDVNAIAYVRMDSYSSCEPITG